MKKLTQIIILALIFALMATPVIASSISNALWYGLITISNNSTSATNVATTANISTENLINDNYLNATANNCVVRSSSGADVAFMPGYTDANLWSFFVPSIGANSYLTYILYTAESTGGELRYFPAAGGMATTDNETLELGDNFTIEQKGWVDTSYSANKSLVYKPDAFRTFISNVEEITSAIAIPNGANLDFVPGNGDWVRVPDHADFSFTDGAGNDEPFSFTAWVNFDDVTSATILAKNTAAANNREWKFTSKATDKLRLECIHNDDAGILIGQETTVVITGYEDTWTHFAVTYDGSETAAGIKLYIDGYPVAMTDISAGVYTGMTAGTGVVEIGSSDVGTAALMDGGLAEIKVYSSELSSTQILVDFGGGHGTSNLVAYWKIDEGAGLPQDSSGNAHHANQNLADWDTDFQRQISVIASSVSSSNITVTTDTSGNVTGGLDFDGASGDVQIADDPAIQNIFDGGGTVECWINADSEGDTGGRIASKVWQFYVTSEVAGRVKVSFQQPFSGANGWWTSTSTEIDLNAWTHMVVTYNSSDNMCDPIIYVNNSPVVLNEGSTPTGTRTTDAGTDFLIGNRPADDKTFDGTIDEVRSYTRIMGQPEVTINYNGGTGLKEPADSTNLAGHWRLDMGEGTVAYDETANTNDGTISNGTWVQGHIPSQFSIAINGVRQDSTRAISVTDNSENWTFLQNYSMMYLEYQKIWILDTLVQHIEWQYGDVFHNKGRDYYALDFDGTDDAVAVSDAASIQNIFDAGGTIECWINADSIGASGGRIVDKVWHSYVYDESAATMRLRFYYPFDGADGSWHTTLRVINANTWYHIVATYDNSLTTNNPIIYIDAVPYTVGDGLTKFSTPTDNRTTDVSANLTIGNRLALDRSFDGTIDEMRFYTRILGQAEITANYNSGAGNYNPDDASNLVGWWHFDDGSGITAVDSSGNNNNGTLTNMDNSDWVEGKVLPPPRAGDVIPTFRSASSDLDVSANMTAFLPVAEAKAPDYVLGLAPAFFTATPNITGAFTTVPPAPVGGFPLAGVITAVANATGTPPQLPLLIIAVFVILAASLSMSAIMRKSGSGTLIVKIIVIVAFMGIFIALRNFGIDFWMLVVFLMISVALAMGSRQLGWQ